MRHKMYMVWFLLGLLVLPIRAQDGDQTGYRLREPSAAEYLEVIPGILNAWRELIPMSLAKLYENPATEVILLEMQQNYSDAERFTQSFDTLSVAYDALASSMFSTNTVSGSDLWAQSMLQISLRENPTDLAQSESLAIPGYEIVVTPIDFNNDAADEYWLDVL